ncbi:MAG: ATP-binding cassette domain-containing protein [Clostridia bacterium]|nr:ATP-binding cassette domain-containing protein [Clostridia bacterium]
MLELVKVCKSYKVGGNVTEALKNVSISFRESEFVSILGPSGCGKTTLLNIIGGLDRYDSGDLIVRDVSTKKYKDRNWDTYRNHSIGFVFQTYNLIPHQTVFANVELALTLAGVSKSERKKRVLEALEKVGLSDQIHKKPNQMSGGQMQRVAIARAIVNDPEILLADEPTGALDSKTSVQIMEILKEISRDRLIIMVTHNPELAEEYSTRIVRLRDGEIISDSNPYDANASATAPETAPEPADVPAPVSEDESASEADIPSETENASAPGTDEAASGVSSVLSSDDTSFEKEAIEKFRKIRNRGDLEENVKEPAEVTETAQETETVSEKSSEENTVLPAESEDAENTVNIEENASSNEPETEKPKYSKGRKSKTKMSFLTALSLSFKNLLTKKGRTFITSFAGSIGIIGIALILAISTGVKNYIDDVQRETLSSYPIMIEAEHRDITSILGSVRNKRESKPSNEKEPMTAYSNTAAYDLFNAIFADATKQNNMKAFKTWLENELTSDNPETNIGKYLNTVHYTYDIDIQSYVRTAPGGDYENTSAKNILGDSGLGESLDFVSSAFSSSSYSYSMWDEIIPEKDGSPISQLIKDQYDLIYGDWPKEYNEVLLLVDSNNEIPDMAFFTLGVMSRDELSQSIVSALAGKEVHFKEHKIAFEDLKNIDLKIVIPSSLYMLSDDGKTYENVADNNTKLQMIVKSDKAIPIKICGVIRANPDATATAISSNTTFCYTNLLSEYIIEKTAQSEVVKALLASEDSNRDIFNGLPYVIDNSGLTDADRIAAFRKYSETMTPEEKAAAYKKIMTTPSEEFIKEKLAEIMSAETREQMEKLVADSYGMDLDVIRQYLSAYSDEELEKMLRETAEKNLREMYAKEAEAMLLQQISTPTAEELAAAKEFLLSVIVLDDPEKAYQNKLGAIAAAWEELGVMTAEEAYTYLLTLEPEAVDSILDNLLEKTAISMYAQNAAQDPDRATNKLASAFDAYVLAADDETAIKGYEIVTVKNVSENSFADNKKMIGCIEKDSPKAINLYPETFENKEKIANIITKYNDSKENEDDRIYYTDYVALLMSGITTIINAISYVLIAFVSVSLLVSSIMIGIITYISVLERTKEIGILRSIGASKLDVSRVFTAETLIIGFAAGVLGIGISYLACIPGNEVVHFYTHINTINAVIPPLYAAGLVVISMLLTFIAGLFPSGIAARKDPVVALRTE